ncbi:MAG: LPS assembly lipoprotein LptE [Betaproteobacteria bacterium]
MGVIPAQAGTQRRGQAGGKTLGPRLHEDDQSARRAAIGRLAAVLGLSGGLVACGFRLRGSQTLPFNTVFLALPVNSALGVELARNIRAGTNAEVVSDRTRAEAIFELLNETREREVLAVNAQGSAREYQLRLRLAFRVHDGKGTEFVPASAVLVQRDLAFNEQQVLAREAEEVLLFREMQSDAVQQILRRIGAAKPVKS